MRTSIRKPTIVAGDSRGSQNGAPRSPASGVGFGKIISALWLAVLLGVCANTRLLGQPFDSGSNGSYGAINVTNDTTLVMASDGVFHCTTITVASGRTLRFTGNALNTPVYLLAQGDVDIRGTIDVSGTAYSTAVPGVGGPGGFDGGAGAVSGLPAGEGKGPGGGKAGERGVYALTAGSNSRIYGNSLLMPLIGGSGAGGTSSYGGGGGGGAILIASSTKVTVTGMIDARGGQAPGGVGYNGSGGAIRIVAPLVAGSGSLNASSYNYNGNDGRIRIDSLDRYAYRTLYLYGRFAAASSMVVFPPSNPRLDIISAAGTAIPVGTNCAVAIMLPSGASTNQTVRVQARGSTNDVPIRVKVTPENGPSCAFDSVIALGSGNPPYADVNVTLMPDMVCYIHAWTR